MKPKSVTSRSPFSDTMRASLVRVFLRAYHDRPEIGAALARFPKTTIALFVSAESVDRADRVIHWEVVFDRRSKAIRVTDFATYRENRSHLDALPQRSLVPTLSMTFSNLDALAAVAEDEMHDG